MSAEMHDYAIALQRAIDAHCRGELITEDVAKECPYHAGKLNRNRVERDRLEAEIDRLRYENGSMSAEQGCTRSHPHEQMDKSCELRTEVAILTNHNARLKAANAELAEALEGLMREWTTPTEYLDSAKAARAALTKHKGMSL